MFFIDWKPLKKAGVTQYETQVEADQAKIRGRKSVNTKSSAVPFILKGLG